MPFKMTNWLEEKLANYILRGITYTFPSTVYLGLFTAFTESNDGATFTEVSTSGTGYTRRPLSFTAAAAGATENSADVTFPMATTNWGALTYMGIFDALTNGNMMYWGTPQTVLSCNIGEQVEFLGGELDVTITGNPTETLASEIVNMTLRNTPRALPVAWYVALLTSYTSDVSYNEVVDATYVREPVVFAAPSNGLVANSGQLLFPAATGSFTVSHAAVFDALSGGNMLVRGELPVPKAVVATQQFQFAAGDFEVQCD